MRTAAKKERDFPVHEMLAAGMILATVGGFLDAYSYLLKGGVFANAETGNLVLMGMRLATGEWWGALQALCPVLAFFAGVLVTELLKARLPANLFLGWQHVVLLVESLLLFFVGLFPSSFPSESAVVIIAFICSMQVNAFRKTRGLPYATTMCTGNLRSAAECAHRAFFLKDRQAARDMGRYLLIIGMFLAGAALGAWFCGIFAERAVWFCCAALLALFFLLLRD